MHLDYVGVGGQRAATGLPKSCGDAAADFLRRHVRDIEGVGSRTTREHNARAAALMKTLQMPDVVERLRQGGIEPFTQDSPEAFAAFFKDEPTRRAAVAHAAGARVEQ